MLLEKTVSILELLRGCCLYVRYLGDFVPAVMEMVEVGCEIDRRGVRDCIFRWEVKTDGDCDYEEANKTGSVYVIQASETVSIRRRLNLLKMT